jgi:outer membrane protein insertion porin family
LGFCSLLALNPLAYSIGPYQGKAIVSIDIAEGHVDDEMLLRNLIDIEPGYLLSAELLQKSVKRLYSLGRYSAVQVYVKERQNAVTLEFHLRPKSTLDSIEVRGNQHLSEDWVLRSLRLRRGDEFHPNALTQLESMMIAQMHRRGFINASVDIQAHQGRDSPHQYTLVVHLREGASQLISAIRFLGQPDIEETVLRELLGVEVGDRADQQFIEQSTKNLHQALLHKGFGYARVDTPRLVNEGTTVSLEISLWRGPRVALFIMGNALVPDETLLPLNQTFEKPLTDEALAKLMQTIKSEYISRGFWDVDISQFRIDDPSGDVQRIIVALEEGEPVVVENIDIIGAQNIPAQDVREHILSTVRNALDTPELFSQFDPSILDETHEGLTPWSKEFARKAWPGSMGISPDKRWVPELYERAIMELERIYHDRGYLTAQISSPKMQRKGQTINLGIQIDEGPQTTVQSVTFIGNQALSSASCLELIGNKEVNEKDNDSFVLGQGLSQSQIDDARNALSFKYKKLGYLYVQVFTEISYEDEQNKADLLFRIEEGPLVRVENLLVIGNKHTDENVIKERISLHPGDVYELDKALDDQRNISSLGAFKNVRVKLIDEHKVAERKDVVAEVLERKRQAFGTLLGLSTAEGVRLGLTYDHYNLFSNATSLNIEASIHRQIFFGLYGEYSDLMRTRYNQFSFSQQWTDALERDITATLRSRSVELWGVPIALRFDLSNQRDNTLLYFLEETAATLGMDLFPGHKMSAAIEPRISTSTVSCPDVSTGDLASSSDESICLAQLREELQRPVQKGQRWTFKIGPRITLDGRNDRFAPTSGYWLGLSALYALGESRSDAGESDLQPFAFTKFEGHLVSYLNMNWSVWVATVRAGHIATIDGKSNVPLDERFLLGGRDTIRGFVENSIFPVGNDVFVVDGTNVSPGGLTFLLLRNELRFQLTKDFSIDLFVDVGNLWDTSLNTDTFALRVSTGCGLRYDMGFGVAVLDLGFKINKRPGENLAEPHISLTRF